MADGLISMSDQFQGLPMDSLIGGPLTAACNANLNLAKTTASYIESVGFELDNNGIPIKVDKDGKIIEGNGKENGSKKPRMVDFAFERPNQDEEGNYLIEKVDIKVPLLAIVPIPNLQINTVDIIFDMEVKSSTSEKSSKDSEAALEGTAKVGWGPFSVSVKVSGKTSCHQENIRTSDNSAKYHVEVHAGNAGIPEGLARVLDMMAEAAKPRHITQHKMDGGSLIETTGSTPAPS